MSNVKFQMFELDAVPSTNTYLLENAARFKDGDAVFTLNQTAGRGRLGRNWDGTGQTLCLSILKKSSAPPLYPLAAGLAVLKALEPLGIAALLKWPNDVLVARKKICGILCEGRFVPEPVCVAGIGVNLYQSAEYFRERLPFAASIFSAAGQKPEPAFLAAQIIRQLEELLNWDEDALLHEYSSVCETLGRCVTVNQKGIVTPARAIGINPDGSLNAEFEDGIRPVYSEISTLRIE
ncbi:MAG: biotin--[acetyl-CoA-carboxylase] ligase [Oscillospiraceae bacterium]|nr:biotin--[acetyl-CoA-carboxylase] ligase [Oscillospiraceae bacterium]